MFVKLVEEYPTFDEVHVDQFVETGYPKELKTGLVTSGVLYHEGAIPLTYKYTVFSKLVLENPIKPAFL